MSTVKVINCECAALSSHSGKFVARTPHEPGRTRANFSGESSVDISQRYPRSLKAPRMRAFRVRSIQRRRCRYAQTMRTTAISLLRSSHPGPSLAVTVVATILGISVGLEPWRLAVLTLVVATNQLSTGLSNDWIDAARDTAIARSDKPVALGLVNAATVRNATVTRDEHGVWSVSGSVSGVDRFRVTQRPLTFEVVRQGGSPWRWPISELQMTDGSRIIASLGPKESDHGESLQVH